MSDVEDSTPAVAAPETNGRDSSGRDTSELPSYDDALLIKVKGKVKRPVRPDDSERNITITKLQAEVTRNSDRIKEIKEILDARRNTTRTVPIEQQEIRKKLDVLKNEFQTVLRQKQHIRDELNDAINQRTALREEIRSARDKVPRGVQLDSLETKVQELEWRLEHESVPEAEEKRLQQQLTSMVAARPLARSYAVADAKLKEVEDTRAAISKRLSDCDAVLKEVKAKEEVERAALDAARGKDKDAGPGIDYGALTVEKQECWQIMSALRDKITEIRKAFDEQYKEYIKLDKNYNAWLRHDKRKKFEERQKERESRDADRRENDEAATGEHTSAEPYESEIFTLDQLLTYLRNKFQSLSSEAKKEEEAAKEVEIPKGMKLFKRKEEDDFMIVSKKAPKGNAAAKSSASSGAAATPQAVKAEAPKAKKLTHTLEILQTFMKFGIEVPTSADAMPATIEKAEAKKVHYFELRKKKKEAPAPKKEKAAEAAESNGEHKEEEEAAAPAVAAEANGASSSKSVEDPPATAAAPAAEKEEAAAEVEATPSAAAAPAEEKTAAASAAETPAAAEGKKKKKKKQADIVAVAASGDAADGIGMALDVDKVTQEVSVKLQVAA